MKRPAPVVIAHRGNIDGPSDPSEENTLPLLLRAVELGYSLETDFRAAGRHLVLSHDPADWSADRDAATLLRVLDENASIPAGPRRMHAFNVKDQAGLHLLLDQLDRLPVLRESCFLFDFELAFSLPTAAREMKAASARTRVAHRISDRERYLQSRLDSGNRLFWCDEFEDEYIDESRLRSITGVGADAFLVSPDLHGRRDVRALRARWHSWTAAGASGICTDYANLLAHDLETR